MYIPDYSITSKTLKNIALIEYGKAVIENTTILTTWEKQLQKDALNRTITYGLELEGYNVNLEGIKPHIDRLTKHTPTEIVNFEKAVNYACEVNKSKEFEEEDIKVLHKLLTTGMLPPTRIGKYRSMKGTRGVNPEEILAQMGELMDWYHSLDAKDTHTVVLASIIRYQTDYIIPFETFNRTVADLTSLMCLQTQGYQFKQYVCLQEYYRSTRYEYDKALKNVEANANDLTAWIEYYSEGLALEVSKIKDQVQLLARDTKIAKASGRVLLSARQERIIEYLQDYGIIQNKDFDKLFPAISEDTVLRELKELVDKHIIIKVGKTKSSRYELK